MPAMNIPTLQHNFRLALNAPANASPARLADDLNYAIQIAIDSGFEAFAELAKTSFFTVEPDGSETPKCDSCVVPEKDTEDAGVL